MVLKFLISSNKIRNIFLLKMTDINFEKLTTKCEFKLHF